jgi:hypothetical protein
MTMAQEVDGNITLHRFGHLKGDEAYAGREEIAEWFSDSGLLWFVNRFVLHPAGVALAWEARAKEGDPNFGQPMTPEEEAQIGLMYIWPDDVWSFDPQADIERGVQFQEFVAGLPPEGQDAFLRMLSTYLAGAQMMLGALERIFYQGLGLGTSDAS